MYRYPKEYGIQPRGNPAPKRRLLRPYEWKDRIIVMNEREWTSVSLFAAPTHYSKPSTRKMIIPEKFQLEDEHEEGQNQSLLYKVFDVISSITLVGRWFEKNWVARRHKKRCRNSKLTIIEDLTRIT